MEDIINTPDTIDTTRNTLSMWRIFQDIDSIVLIIGLVILIICLKKKYYKGVLYTIISYGIVWIIKRLFEFPMSGGLLSSYEQYNIYYLVLIIISIIIQLIPFIMCLRKNKNVKKDEVKQ